MSKAPEHKKNTPRFLVYFSLAGVLELPFFLGLFTMHHGFLVAEFSLSLAMHLLAAITIFFAQPRGEGWFHHERSWPRAFFLWVIFLPTMGWIAAGVLYLFYSHLRNVESLFSEEDEFFNAGSERLFFVPQTDIPLSKRISRGLDFLPLADVMAGENIALKRGAIDNLYRLGNPESISLLLSYRNDPSPDVRFFVTTALTKIKKEFDEELDASRRQMQRDIYKVSSRVFLAKIYLRYAKSGLLDEVTGVGYTDEALHHLHYALDSGYARDEVYWILFDLYYGKKQWSAALEILDRMAASGKVEDKKLLQASIKIFFRQGSYHDLARTLRDLTRIPGVNDEWKSLAIAWAELT